MKLSEATADKRTIESVVLKLYNELKVPVDLVRGLGIQLSRLEPDSSSGSSSSTASGGGPALLNAWLKRGATAADNATSKRSAAQGLADSIMGNTDMEISSLLTIRPSSQEEVREEEEDQVEEVVIMPPPAKESAAAAAAVPRHEDVKTAELTLSQLDPHVLSELPPEVREEVLRVIGGGEPPRDDGGGHGPSGAQGIHPESLSQIDRTALDALPMEIRREFEEEFALMGGAMDVSSRDSVTFQASSSSSSIREHGRGGRPRQASLFQYHQLWELDEGKQRELQALPLSLRLQVVQHPEMYYRDRAMSQEVEKKEKKKKNPTTAPSGTSPSRATTAPAVIDLAMDDTPPVKSGIGALFAVEDVGIVKYHLVSWLKGIEEATDAHLQVVSLYLLELVETGRVDEACLLLRAFHRVAQAKPGVWAAGYDSVKRAVDRRISEQENDFQKLYFPKRGVRCQIQLAH